MFRIKEARDAADDNDRDSVFKERQYRRQNKTGSHTGGSTAASGERVKRCRIKTDRLKVCTNGETIRCGDSSQW